MAFGGEAAGNIKANDVDNAAGNIKYKGFNSKPRACKYKTYEPRHVVSNNVAF